MRLVRLLGRVVPLVVVAAVAACSLFVSTDDLTGGSLCDGGGCVGDDAHVSPPADSAADACSADLQTDPANCGSCGYACGAATPRCQAGACAVGCAGGIVYVSPTGMDTADGCTPGTSLATIAHAIAAVTSSGATGEEIHVCHGVYAETDLPLGYPVSLLGGYDCTTWTRTATYGYPTFDGVNETRIVPTSASTTGETVTISNPGVDATISFDGFTVEAAATGTTKIVGAILVSVSAAPKVSNNVVDGSASASQTSAGIVENIGGAAEIFHNTITGGGGAMGSRGIDVSTTSAAYIHDNVIDGGTSPVQTWGIRIAIDTPHDGQAEYVTDNQIGSGTGPIMTGIDIQDTDITLTGNTVIGGSSTCTASCQSWGMRVYADDMIAHVATIAQNRVTGGLIHGTNPLLVGIQVTSLGRVSILDNAAQAGTADDVSGDAILLKDVAEADVQLNTAYGRQESLDLIGVTNAYVAGNLFLGDVSNSSTGVSADSCTGATGIQAFSDNAFVNHAHLLSVQTTQGTTCTPQVYDTIRAVEGLYATSASLGAANNRRVAATCGAVGDAGAGDDNAHCVVESTCTSSQTTPSACIGRVLATWADDSQGAADLLDRSRTWKLAANVPCIIGQGVPVAPPDPVSDDGGVDYVAVDVNSTTRTTPYSIGAYEDDGSCAP